MHTKSFVKLLVFALILSACNGAPPSTEVATEGVPHAEATHSEPTPTHGANVEHATEVAPTTPGVVAPPLASAPGWLMFHKDEQHTGVAEGVGNIDPAAGPVVRWTYAITDPPTEADFAIYRWYASLPLGDLDGDGTLEVVVTTPDNSGEADRVIALKDVPGETPAVRELWTYASPIAPGEAGKGGFDQYSAALADADGDGLLDVLFSSKDGFVRALKGTTGQVIWEYQTGHFIESGPMIADLDGDGAMEVIIPTDCELGPSCPGSVSGGALFVFSAQPSGDPLLWMREYPWKLDSAEPAIADLDANDGEDRKAIVFGSWGGILIVLWQNPDGQFVEERFDIRALDSSIHAGSQNVVIRSSPLLAEFGESWAAVFGWMPDWTIGTEARVSAVGIRADMQAGTVEFTPMWTLNRDDWKSSVALLPVQPDAPWIVTGYGIGTTQGTGNYGLCEPPMGGILAVNAEGEVQWENEFVNEGNVRGSAAVADMDGDGNLEVLLALGCYGKIYAFDGGTGEVEWSLQLGPRTIGSPSIGDLDGDGDLEIVVVSYDGMVYVLGGE